MKKNEHAADKGLQGARSDAGAEETLLLARHMPPAVANGLATFLIGVTFAALLIIVFVPFPETITSPFTIVPATGMEPVEAPRDGIVKQVAVRDGAEVAAGDLLFVIRSEALRVLAMERVNLQRDIDNDWEQLRKLQAEARARRLTNPSAIAEVRRLLHGIPAQEMPASTTKPRESSLLGYREPILNLGSFQEPFSTNELQEQLHRLKVQAAQRQVENLREQLPVAAQQLKTARTLLELLEDASRRNLTTELEVNRQRFAYQQARLDLQTIPFQLKEAEAQLKMLQTLRRQSISEEILAEVDRTANIRQLEIAIEANTLRLDALERELLNVEDDRIRVVASHDGTVVAISIQRPGAVVERNEVLCQLARADATLQAELRISEKDVGLLRQEQAVLQEQGQDIRLLFNAFPYTRFGVRHANLTWISPVGVDNSFRALASLDDSTIVVKDRKYRIKAGMGGEARIIVSRRTLLEYVLEPLRQFEENVGLVSSGSD